MLKVSLDNGRTVSYDLADPVESRIWRLWQADPGFQRKIRGIGIHRDKVVYVLPVPHHSAPIYDASVVPTTNGMTETISCLVDDCKVTMTVYSNGDGAAKMVKVDYRRTGKRRLPHP